MHAHFTAYKQHTTHNTHHLHENRALFEHGMMEHEEGEMHRQPLDSVILSLRGMLGGHVLPILENVLEPPRMENIDRYVLYLYIYVRLSYSAVV
jgi:hypothetical protein